MPKTSKAAPAKTFHGDHVGLFEAKVKATELMELKTVLKAATPTAKDG